MPAPAVITDDDLPTNLGGSCECKPNPVAERLEGMRQRTIAAWMDPGGKTRQAVAKTRAYASIDVLLFSKKNS
jgi:hypothetical protein